MGLSHSVTTSIRTSTEISIKEPGILTIGSTKRIIRPGSVELTFTTTDPKLCQLIKDSVKKSEHPEPWQKMQMFADCIKQVSDEREE